MMLMVCCFTDSLSLKADRHRRVAAPVALVELDVGGAGIPLVVAISEVPSVPVARPVRAPAPSAHEVCCLHFVSVSLEYVCN